MELAQAYSFDPLYASSDYGAGTTVALVEMSGAGYSSGDITTFANCYGITLGNGQVTEETVAGGGATGGGTVEAELDIDTVLSLAPKANIEVYEGGPTANMYTVFSQIVSDDTAKIVSASWTNGCEAYVGQAYQNSENTLFQAAAVDGQSIFVAAGDQGAEGCNVNGVVGRIDGHPARGASRGPQDRHPLHRQQVLQHAQRGQRGEHRQSFQRGRRRLGRRRGPDPMRWRSTRRTPRCSWPTARPAR